MMGVTPPSPEPRLVDLVHERRAGRLVGSLTMLSVLLTLTAVVISARGARDAGGSGSLATFAKHDQAQLLAALLRVGGIALSVPFMILWHRLIRSRDRTASTVALAVGITSCALIAASTLIGWFALHALADDLSSSRYSSERQALDASTALDLIRWLDISARIVFATWLCYASLRASGVGLLTPSLGIWGVLAALSGTVSPVGDALFIGWLASAGLLLIGVWPGGRPRSWESGKREPWTSTS
jgi:hypothetical protein